MQTKGSIINILLPLLLIVAIGVAIYAIILFLRSLIKKSPALRSKSLKIATIPLLYILCMVFYFMHISEHDKQLRHQLPGTYTYRLADSIQFSAIIRPGSSFTFKMGADTISGHWRLVSNTETIRFFDRSGKEFTHSTLASDSGRICLPFNFNGKQIRFYKQ